jgi:cytochrome d ubiquinol oxidase subunit I
VPAASILGTLALFVLCYGIVFSMGIYYINRLIAQGPQGRALEDTQGLPNRPIAAAGAAAGDAISGRH